MNDSAKDYMTANLVALENAGDNMPAGFPAIYNAAATAWQTLYDSFLGATDTGVATDAKIKANNVLFDLCMGVCNDAPYVFTQDDEASTLSLFAWKNIMDVINPPGSASCSFKVLDQNTNLPLANVVFNIWLSDGVIKSVVTDENGVALFSNIDSGTYSYSAALAEYVTATGTKEVDSGVDARKTVYLVHV